MVLGTCEGAILSSLVDTGKFEKMLLIEYYIIARSQGECTELEEFKKKIIFYFCHVSS